jgi:hypothetical protein
MIFLKKELKRIPIVMIFFRIIHAFKYYSPTIIQILKWSTKSKEIGTFTYKLTENNIEYLIQNVSIITKLPYEKIKYYYKEIDGNETITSYVKNKIYHSEYKFIKDMRCDFGSRLAYYCIVRALKPNVVVENGVELGYTGLVLCTALLKNSNEGFPGIYYGLDIDSNAGLLINESPYSDISKMIIGESLTSLSDFKLPIDFYFSDGGRSASYELKEFEILQQKLSKQTIVVSNKLNFSNALSQLAKKMQKKHIYFREEPLDHWYPGSHIGIMF